jgi:hypothetical protein
MGGAVSRKFSRRPTLRESLESSKRAQDFYAAMAGKPPIESKLLRRWAEAQRAAPRRDHSKPLERSVLKAITQALRLDRRVARVERNQSGLFREGDRFIRVGSRGKLDLTVYLKSGRYVEIEVKRPGGKPEPHQQQRIDAIRASGGLAGCATSIDEALALLP